MELVLYTLHYVREISNQGTSTSITGIYSDRALFQTVVTPSIFNVFVHEYSSLCLDQSCSRQELVVEVL